MLLIVLAGCSFQDSTNTVEAIKDRSLTPEEAARTTTNCLPEQAGPDVFQVRDQVPYEFGLLVLFTATCPGTVDPSQIYDVAGYAVVEQHQGLWAILFSNWSGTQATHLQQEAILIGQGGQAGQQILYGRALNPEAVAVEIRFSNGKVQTLQIKNEVFHLLVAGSEHVCGRKVFAADGSVLEQQDLPPEVGC